jgi:hypothetical protein
VAVVRAYALPDADVPEGSRDSARANSASPSRPASLRAKLPYNPSTRAFSGDAAVVSYASLTIAGGGFGFSDDTDPQTR